MDIMLSIIMMMRSYSLSVDAMLLSSCRNSLAGMSSLRLSKLAAKVFNASIEDASSAVCARIASATAVISEGGRDAVAEVEGSAILEGVTPRQAVYLSLR